MRILAVSIVLLAAASAHSAVVAAPADACKQCREHQRACMSNYPGPTCKTEYDRCMKSCRRK